MSLFFAAGSETHAFSAADLKQALCDSFESLGSRGKIIAVPPDITRYHSRAGDLTRIAFEYYGDRLTRILPATGTHTPMSRSEIELMYPGIPPERFAVHDFRNGLVTLGEVPSSFVREQSEGRLDFSWPVQLDRLLVDGGL